MSVFESNLSPGFNDESAADHPDLMTEEEYAVAFKKMAADYFIGKTEETLPVLTYVTGLPGAGKSSFVDKARTLEEFKNAVLINFDDLRIYHPRYEDHVKKDPVNAAARIDKSVETLIGWLCEEAAKRKIHVILDDAAMGQEMTKIVLSPFREQGYKIDAVVVAVPSIIARQSVHLRFEENFAEARAGKPVLPRWVNKTEQDNAPAALVETVETLEEEKLADRLRIISRDGHVFHDSLATQDKKAGTMVKQEMTRELNDAEVKKYQDCAVRIAGLMAQRNAAAPDTAKPYTP